MSQRINAQRLPWRELTLSGAILLAAACEKSPFGPASTQLAFIVQPSRAAGGTTITPAVQVAAEDSNGNTVTGFHGVVTVTIEADTAGGALGGTTAASAINGVATFRTLSINKAGTGYALAAAAAGLPTATSAAFDIVVGPAARLSFTVQPSNSQAGASIAPAVQVAAVDAGSNTVTTFTGNVTIAIDSNPGGGTLSGTTTVQAVGGVATFSDLSISPAGAGYSLSATSGALATPASAPFIVATIPTALHITTVTTGTATPPKYSLCVDPNSGSYPGPGCRRSGPIGANGAVSMAITPGYHSVELDGVPANCALTGDTANPRQVTASGTTEVPFALACLDTGTVRIAVTTTGTDLDQNGYYACVSRAANDCFWSTRLLINDMVTISGVTAEAHTVSIGDVVVNCTVSGDTLQTLNLLAHDTTTVSFNIGCALAERIAYTSLGTITDARLDGVSSAPVTHGFAPVWSADGIRLAYECGLDICAINPDGSGFAQLTTTAAGNRHPAWSPDGTKIAFSAAPSGAPDLWVVAADGSGAVRLTQNAGFVGSPAWSPDGTKIAFDCQVDPANDDICVVNADGTGLTRLTNDPARDYGAAWKRDGSTLAFATTRYGVDEIVLMSASGGSVTRIGAGLAGSEPTWSPDGTQLAFVRLDQSGTANILAAHTDGSNVVTIVPGDQPAWKPHS